MSDEASSPELSNHRSRREPLVTAKRIILPDLARDLLSARVLDEMTARWPDDRIYRFQTYIDEAVFFFKVVREQIESSHVRSVVDVGSGIGLFGRLLATLGVRVTCLEPGSEGFTDVIEMSEIIEQAWTSPSVQFDFRKEYLSDFARQGLRGDFYTCINVIEHVPSFEDFLGEIIYEVGVSGYAYIVFPNYSFPYEPHFSIPTLWSKKLTQKAFSKAIGANRHHLQEPWEFWGDLSFPNYRKTRRIVRALGANYKFSRDTFLSYFSRLSDQRFVSRKGVGFAILRRFRATGLCVGRLIPLAIVPVVDLRISPRS